MSSNVTPISRNIGPMSASQQQDWWFPPPQGNPGCGPPQPCPPQPCPQPPSCFSPVAQANACWDQSQSLYNLVSKVVMDIFATNPGIIPPPPPSQGSGPILGVTNGSDAQPGQVGEFYELSTPVTFGAAAQNQVITGGVLQPGDWDVSAGFYPGVWVAGAVFYLSPPPIGVSANMVALVVNLSTMPGDINESNAVVFCPPARALLSVPTVFPFNISTNVLATGSASTGDASFIFTARRRR